jgi:hypothetical protein
MSFISRQEDLPASHGSLGWVSAGFTLFAFAAPSAVQSAPYFIGNTGFLGGTIFVTVNTFFACLGSWMLLQVKLQYPSAHSFGELGDKVYGPVGRVIGNLIQLGNFVLFLPCALLFTAEALQGIGKPWGKPFTMSDGAPCWDYYILIIALVCYMTTQARVLTNTAIFSAISVGSVLVIAITQLVACFSYDVEDKQPAQWFGNPDSYPDSGHWSIFFSRGASIAVFGYVPSFLTAELASCMREPKQMTKSLALSGGLNLLMMLGVGIPVVSRWGYNQGYVAPLTGQFAGPGTAKVSAYDAGNAATTVLNSFVLIGNFVSYMLDSVPLGRFCQKTWAPDFKDTWSAADLLRYAGYTFPTFFVGLLLAFFFPSLDFLVDCLTFLTTPWVTMVYPAALYWRTFHKGAGLLDATRDSDGSCVILVSSTLTMGLVGFAVSLVAGLGMLSIDGTASWQIGCEGWFILKPH